jgi:hypothetical protein
VKPWKVAISLAAVGALGAPFVLGTWKARPIKGVWVPLTEEQRQQIESHLKARDYCNVGVFGLAMVLPAIALRYWRWLRT